MFDPSAQMLSPQMESEMKKIVALTVLGTVGFTGLAHAGNAGSSLGDCYNHVISVCNQGNHPVPCSEAGMDACDEEHSASISMPKFQIKALRKNATRSIQIGRTKPGTKG